MYVDKELELSDAQALSASGASTNSIDVGADVDAGIGEAMYLVVQHRAAMGGTSPTFQVGLQTDDNDSFSSPTTVLLSPAEAAPAAGKQTVIPLPPGLQRYVRAYYTLGGTTPTANVDAFIAKDVQAWVSAPDAL